MNFDCCIKSNQNLGNTTTRGYEINLGLKTFSISWATCLSVLSRLCPLCWLVDCIEIRQIKFPCLYIKSDQAEEVDDEEEMIKVLQNSI